MYTSRSTIYTLLNMFRNIHLKIGQCAYYECHICQQQVKEGFRGLIQLTCAEFELIIGTYPIMHLV